MNGRRQCDIAPMRVLMLGVLIALGSPGCGSNDRSVASNPLATCDFLTVPELPFKAAGMHAGGNDEQHGCLVNGASAAEQAAINIRRYDSADAAAQFVREHPQGEPYSRTMGEAAVTAVAVHGAEVITVQLQAPTGDLQALAVAIAQGAADSL